MNLKDELESAVTRAQAAVGRVEATADRIENLHEKTKHRERKEDQPLTDHKGFSGVPVYKGELEEYEDWAFKTKDFLEGADSRFKDLLKKIGNDQDDSIDSATIRTQVFNWGIDDIDWLDDQLYHVLVQKVSGTNLATLRNLNRENGVRGIMAWKRLNIDAQGQNQLRTHELSKRVLSPMRMHDINKLLPAMERWEAHLHELQTITGGADQIPEIIRITALRNLMPQEMDDDLRKLGKDHVTTFDNLKKYIIGQCRERKEPYFEAAGATRESKPAMGLNLEKNDEEDAEGMLTNLFSG